MKVQSVLFPSQIWARQEARLWLIEHGYTTKKVDDDGRYYRFRQREPVAGARCARKTILSDKWQRPIVLLLCD